MGRSSTARDRLLSSACELMHTRGYAAIGVAEICARADVRKGSFYHFFPSKQALTAEVVNAHWQRQRIGWQTALAAGAESGSDRGVPLAGVKRLERLVGWLVDGQRQAWEETGRVDGCLLGNLAVELSSQELGSQELGSQELGGRGDGGDQEPGIRRRLGAIFEEQAALIESALGEGTRDVARTVVAQIEGAVLMSRLAGDITPLAGLWPAVRRLVAGP
ncbi:TetR/AcrR family transcriptional regulator [Actinoplanes subglobosus]|uniref:TetR/AcrR family transcriptional regulator n=1 Tax=Actinoplanes subglobosus TaxID=1547892 RepID=A0ABV8JA65_9ACTN